MHMRKDSPTKFDRDTFRANLLKYTRKAFEMLPALDKPRILDIGCGTGLPAIELARLSGGDIIGIDIDQIALDKFARRAEEAGLVDRVRVRNLSLLEMDFPNESFDVIWAEGSINVVGFEKGLKEWGNLLKPNGFLVVHDELKGRERKLELIAECGFKLLGEIELPVEVWQKEYLEPMKREVERAEGRGEDKDIGKELETSRKEIEMFRKNPTAWASVFFIVQKI